jgi:hypothetical protein
MQTKRVLPKDLLAELVEVLAAKVLKNVGAKEEDQVAALTKLIEAARGEATPPRRRSPRVHQTPKVEEEEEPQREEEPAAEEPNNSPCRAPESPTPETPLRMARVNKLRRLLDPATSAVGQKRKRAFNEIVWDDIKAAYEVDGEQLLFEPTPIPLPKHKVKELVATVKNVLKTNDRQPMMWEEGAAASVAEAVLRTAGSCIKTVKVKKEAWLTNDELALHGRADMMVSKGARKLIVVECKRTETGAWTRGLAQMTIAAETVLSEMLQDNEDSDDCVYGLLMNHVGWTWMRLDRHEGRFHDTYLNMNSISTSIASMASIAYGFMLEQPVTKMSKRVTNKDKRVRRQ